MSLVVRLTKVGRRGESKFRVVVIEKRSRRDGKPVELLGWLIKTTKGPTSEINKERYSYWLSKGARPSDSIRKLFFERS
jgi:small subunit ribosomal protein S16